MAQRTSTRTASTDLTERPGKTTKASFEFGKLFEKPERWDQRHLSLLNIQEYRDASPVDMIGDSYLPGPDDRAFKSLAEDFAKPTRHEILNTQEFPNNQFAATLSALWSALDDMENDCPPTSALYDLALDFQLRIDASNLLKFNRRPIPFHISSLNVKGTLRGCASYVSATDIKRILPLTVFTARNSQGNASAAHEVTPYLLLQLILVYERNSTLDSYAAFAVTMKGTTIQFVKANCSVSYVHDLIDHRTPRTPLMLAFSRPYDLLRQEDREEFMEVYYGIFKCLYARLKICEG